MQNVRTNFKYFIWKNNQRPLKKEYLLLKDNNADSDDNNSKTNDYVKNVNSTFFTSFLLLLPVW